MSIVEAVQRLFTIPERRSRVTDYVNELFAIQAEIDDITAKLGDPVAPANIDELVQRRATLMEKQKILQARKAAAEQEEYRTKLQERQAKFRRELDEELAELREILPRLRYRLAGLQLLEGRLEEGGANWVELTDGLPFGAAQRLSQAIAREIGDSPAWGDVWTPPLLSKFVDEGRRFAKRQAEQQAARDAERQAEFDRKLAAFERGEGADPRVHRFTVKALG
jgi:hypothetical protein